jgi:hypothetical protein
MRALRDGGNLKHAVATHYDFISAKFGAPAGPARRTVRPADSPPGPPGLRITADRRSVRSPTAPGESAPSPPGANEFAAGNSPSPPARTARKSATLGSQFNLPQGFLGEVRAQASGGGAAGSPPVQHEPPSSCPPCPIQNAPSAGVLSSAGAVQTIRAETSSQCHTSRPATGTIRHFGVDAERSRVYHIIVDNLADGQAPRQNGDGPGVRMLENQHPGPGGATHARTRVSHPTAGPRGRPSDHSSCSLR